MRNYEVTLIGKTPLLMHHDDIDWADKMEAWKNDPKNKVDSKAGDDRTPAWRWLGHAYHDNKKLGIPQANIMRSIMDAGAMVPVPGGKSGKTFKAQTQSGMMSSVSFWPLILPNGNTVDWAELNKLKDINDFETHKEMVRQMGFDILVKRARIGQAKHVRVRPQFPVGWVLKGGFSVWDDQLTMPILEQILNFAGQYKGIGDWRPSSKTPGPYGMFDAEIREI